MILLAAGYGNELIDVLIVLFILLIILTFCKKLFFRILARVNRIIFPSLYNKDLSSLKKYEKLILGYRYWITKNSL